MPQPHLNRAVVRNQIQEMDRIFVADDHQYKPMKRDHQKLWPRIMCATGSNGAWYSTLRTLCHGNHDYILYLIGDIGALKCPTLEQRLGCKSSTASRHQQ
jgi:hypothetical protein